LNLLLHFEVAGSMRVFIYAVLSISIAIGSLFIDWGSDSYTWFQRSGAFVVLAGAILSYRSILRMGVSGVGGAPNNGVSIGKVVGSFEDPENGRNMIEVERSQEDIAYERQILIDQIAGYLGAVLAIVGTVICGYGDLLAKI
jgi:hypothetical protein